MDYTQCRITVLYVIHYNPDSKKVINLIQSLVLRNHLFIYAKKMLYTTVNLCFYICFPYMVAYFLRDLIDKIFLFGQLFSHILGQVLIYCRLYILERDIIKLYLYLRNTEPLGYRSINIHSLPGLLILLVRRLVF